MGDQHGADLIFFNGTVMRGEPDHENLAGAEFLEEARTAEEYRLYSIDDRYPAMVRVERDGVTVPGELYGVPRSLWGKIEESEPPGLRRDWVELSDGRAVYGMVGSHELTEGARDISDFGGWRAYRDRFAGS